MTRILVSLTCVAGLSRCVPFEPQLAGLPCNAGVCARGYVCDVANNLCVQGEIVQPPPQAQDTAPSGCATCQVFYRDEDGDGFGTDDGRCTCAPEGVYRAGTSGDCDDSPATCGDGCYPHNQTADTCDGLDQDCDGSTDEQPELVWYHDADGDGFTNVNDTQAHCTDPDGPASAWLAAPTEPDCDDSTLPGRCGAACFPNNPVIDNCDGFDQDCDGVADDDTASVWYHDADLDGFANNSDTQLSCVDPDGTALSWRATTTAHDCDDADASSHPSGSEVCDGRDNDCLGGADNGLGAACACTTGTAKPLDICGDGVDNDCNAAIDEASCVRGWWSCAYSHRKPITLTTHTSALPAGYSLKVVLDHAALVAGGKALADGRDVRIVFFDGSVQSEVPRVLDPDSTWNSATTTLWFALQDPIAAATTNRAYAVYYGSPTASAPPSNEANVFDFADFFERADAAAVGNAWTTTVGPKSSITLKAHALDFTKTRDADQHIPWASHQFPPIDGRVSFRFGYNWQRGTDTSYRIYMQLGASLAAPAGDDSVDVAGIAVDLLSAAQADWQVDEDPTNPLSHEGFGYFAGGQMRQVDRVSGAASIEAVVDLTQATYSLRIRQGGVPRNHDNLACSNSLPSVDTVRFIAHRLGDWTTERRFEWVIVRRSIENDASVVLQNEEPNLC